MKILSVNAGSSSLKFELYQMPEEKSLVFGNVEEIGSDRSGLILKINGVKKEKKISVSNHQEAVKIVAQELLNEGIIKELDEITAIGHRVVHGGEKYSESTIVDEELISAVKQLTELAPLHNPANVTGIEAFKSVLPKALNVAVFDTAFHQTMSKEAYLYAVPYEWYENHKIRKYGFHGTSHRYIYKRACEMLEKSELKVISCHLGNGCSLCAIDNGKSIDTTMGFTPLAGIPMGTRSGDIDSSIIEFIMKKENKNIEEVMTSLNKKSGLLGISGISADSRPIEDAIVEGNERALLASNIYARHIVSYIGAYNTLLGGADIIVFTAGQGENNVHVRNRVVKQLKALGIVLDEEKNKIRGQELLISSNETGPKCYVIPTNEELMIAEDTYELVK